MDVESRDPIPNPGFLSGMDWIRILLFLTYSDSDLDGQYPSRIRIQVKYEPDLNPTRLQPILNPIVFSLHNIFHI